MQPTLAYEPFAEFREITVTEPLRQGDVIEATSPDASQWQRLLLVLTADCDFANAKNQGRVTCVPFLTQDEYLLEFQVPRLRERTAIRLLDALETLIKKLPQAPKISRHRLQAWPMEQNIDAIINALRPPMPDVAQFRELFGALTSVHNPSKDLDSAVNSLIEAQAKIPGGKAEKNLRRDITASLTAHYANPPADALFFSAVAPEYQAGYFAYLRHLEQVQQPEIALGPTRTMPSYRRVSRLTDRFTHAASQRFGTVFMSIGLPSEYEEIRRLHSDILGERFQ